MAFKGSASKSASGASMSKYDVEVEARLKALEAQAHPDRWIDGTGGGDCAALEAKVDRLIDLLNSNNFFEGTSCPKDPDGVKRFH
jgi:hypothetical protein